MLEIKIAPHTPQKAMMSHHDRMPSVKSHYMTPVRSPPSTRTAESSAGRSFNYYNFTIQTFHCCFSPKNFHLCLSTYSLSITNIENCEKTLWDFLFFSLSLSLSLSVPHSLYLSFWLSFSFSLSLPLSLSLYFSIHISPCVSLSLSLPLSLSHTLSTHICFYLSIYLSPYLSIYLPLSLSFSLSHTLSIYTSICLCLSHSHPLTLSISLPASQRSHIPVTFLQDCLLSIWPDQREGPTLSVTTDRCAKVRIPFVILFNYHYS